MKVYVIKNYKGQYQTPDMGFIYPIWLADIFDDYEVAKYHCSSDCNVVECELIEKNELADHDKKVRAEVVDENQALKERWEKLEEWIYKQMKVKCFDKFQVFQDILLKMKELEE